MPKLVRLVSLVALAVGCGGVTPAATGTGGAAGADAGAPDAPAEAAPVTAEDGCMQVAAALCDRLDACSPTALKLYYGDKTVCATRAVLSCMTDQTTSGITRTPDDLVACAEALAPARCTDLLANQYPDACNLKPGTVIDGAACGSNLQCQSTYCNKADGVCGVCGPRVAADGDCTVDDGCAMGLVCANKKCIAPGAPDADCNPPDVPCRADLYCAKATNKCVAKVGVGAACPDDQACDLTKGAFCINKVCEMIDVGRAGDACGILANPKALCTGFTGLGAASDPCSNILGNGVCAKTSEDGTACGTNHEVCLAPASCISGICRLPSAPNCH